METVNGFKTIFVIHPGSYFSFNRAEEYLLKLVPLQFNKGKLL